MHTFTTAAAAALIMLAVPATAFAASKTFEVAPFTEVEISAGIDARIAVGGTAQSVVAESPHQEELDELIVEVRDGKLHAYRDWDLFDTIFSFGRDEDRNTVVTVTVPMLTQVEANSGSDVDVTGLAGDSLRLNSSSGADLTATAVAGKALDLDSSSGSDLSVDGTCESAKVNSSSGSDLRAEKLLCADVDVNASSGSGAEVHASATLKANASSGGDIEVYGKPTTVDQESSSGGDITIH